MKCVKKAVYVEEVIKKSRFLGFIHPCLSEQDVKETLGHLALEHTGANHIAYAYRLKTAKGLVCRFYDAGEPSGTAGKPIFSYIEGYELIDTLIVVVRYFGGVKLGAGGLTRAYGNTAKKVIELAERVNFIEWVPLYFDLDYAQLQSFEYHLAKFSGEITSKEFAANIKISIKLPAPEVDDFLQLFSGRREF